MFRGRAASKLGLNVSVPLRTPNRRIMIAKPFRRTANFAFVAAALLGIAPLTAQGAGFTAGFEGQARDTIGANGALPVGRGVGDGIWTSSGLANWRELDWIPMRV